MITPMAKIEEWMNVSFGPWENHYPCDVCIKALRSPIKDEWRIFMVVTYYGSNERETYCKWCAIAKLESWVERIRDFENKTFLERCLNTNRGFPSHHYSKTS